MIKSLAQKYDNGEVLTGAGTIFPQAPMVPTGGVTPKPMDSCIRVEKAMNESLRLHAISGMITQ